MRRRTFLIAAAAAATPLAAFAQGISLRPIAPENELERLFVAALNDETARPLFRAELLSAQVALALASSAEDAAPLEVAIIGGRQAGAIFTSASRLSGVLGPAAPRVMLTGGAALERLIGKNAVINYRLLPMLTLEPEDVAALLAMTTPAEPAPQPDAQPGPPSSPSPPQRRS